MLRDADGNFYGTAAAGGSYGFGVVFKLTANGTQTVLHAFNGDDGDAPNGLRQDAATGDLYGTTRSGGGDGSSSSGVIFKLTPEGTETALHIFTGRDGAHPQGLTVQDEVGNFYGTTSAGGTNDEGVVYKLSADGTFKVLHHFSDSDGGFPTGRLVRDQQGNFYGATYVGGPCHRCGVVFKLTPDGTYSVFHAFKGGGADGRLPGGLVRDEAGNLYGTAYYGGGGGDGSGLTFKLAPDGKFTALHSFSGLSDGAHPNTLVRAPSGKFYGRTVEGGGVGCFGRGCGTIFRMTREGVVTTLYRFTGNADGCCGGALLTVDKDRNLYGTTGSGGADESGTVFKLRK